MIQSLDKYCVAKLDALQQQSAFMVVRVEHSSLKMGDELVRLHLNLKQGFFFSLQSKAMCHCRACKCVQDQGAFRRICIIHCTLIMDQFPLLLCQIVSLHSVLRPLRKILHFCLQSALNYRDIAPVSIFIHGSASIYKIHMLCSYYLLKCARCCLQHRIE